MDTRQVLEQYGSCRDGRRDRILCCDDHASWEGRKHLIYALDELCARDLVARVWFEDWDLEHVFRLHRDKLAQLAQRTIDTDAFSQAVQERSFEAYVPHDLLHIGAHLAERYGTDVYAGVATPSGFHKRLLSTDHTLNEEADLRVRRTFDTLGEHLNGCLALVGGAHHLMHVDGVFFVPRGIEQENPLMRSAYVAACEAMRTQTRT